MPKQICQSPTIPDTQASKIWGIDAGSRREWTPVRLKEALVLESKMRLHHGLTLTAYRDIAIAISDGISAIPSRFHKDGTEVMADDEEKRGFHGAMDPPCGRFAGGTHYARCRDDIWTYDEPAAKDHSRSAGRVLDEQRVLA
ncbi:hypothetical protein PENDEC_c076G00209 [Penicillium decumbens]|uniref:Uncharacterized protein n=1 Tax=Penicillium decumbens TaxID=69771 RepID=A0A1V6NLI9_PENDC|nr:hypothetical protein PENDEC_c076G00209 [Penicillium decumbens]